jgi:hypothetical protein
MSPEKKGTGNATRLRAFPNPRKYNIRAETGTDAAMPVLLFRLHPGNLPDSFSGARMSGCFFYGWFSISIFFPGTRVSTGAGFFLPRERACPQAPAFSFPGSAHVHRRRLFPSPGTRMSTGAGFFLPRERACPHAPEMISTMKPMKILKGNPGRDYGFFVPAFRVRMHTGLTPHLDYALLISC